MLQDKNTGESHHIYHTIIPINRAAAYLIKQRKYLHFRSKIIMFNLKISCLYIMISVTTASPQPIFTKFCLNIGSQHENHSEVLLHCLENRYVDKWIDR